MTTQAQVMDQVRSENQVHENQVRRNVFCGDVNVVDWTRVNIAPHRTKNSDEKEDGVFAVIGYRTDLNKFRVLFEGTKLDCQKHLSSSSTKYVQDHSQELTKKIEDLLSRARREASGCTMVAGISSDWRAQQMNLQEVHRLTREAIVISRLYDEAALHTMAGEIRSEVREIRTSTHLWIYGVRVFNVRIHMYEADAEEIDWFHDTRVVPVSDGGLKNKAPKFVTHQLVSNGRILVDGSVQGCGIVLEACQNHFAEVARRKEQEEQDRQRKQFESFARQHLGTILRRIQEGKSLNGELLETFRGLVADVRQYEITSLESLIKGIADTAISQLGSGDSDEEVDGRVEESLELVDLGVDSDPERNLETVRKLEVFGSQQ